MLTGLENPLHLLLLFAVILIVFGAKRLPEMGRGLGTGMRDFKSALTAPEPTHEDAPTPSGNDSV
jgi:sec-independent protein translocase protein TatA